MRFRTIDYDELEAAVQLDVRAFRVDAANARKMLEGNSRFTWRDIYGVEKDGELAAMLVAFPMDFWLGGGPLRAAAIASVSVPPEHRRRGVAKFMLRHTHAHFRANGAAIAILYPFAFGFYRSLGYEIAEWRHDYRIPPRYIPLYAERLAVRLARPSDWPGIHAIYEDHLRRRGGAQRSEATWTERFHDRDAELAVYVDDKGVQGYLHYEFKRIQAQRTGEPGWVEVLVREMVAASGAAERGLLGFLAAQQEQADVIHMVKPPDETFGSMLVEPGTFPQRFVEFIMQVTYQGTPGLMLRILDVPTALMARQYPSHVSGAVTLAVDDPEMPNAGPWRVVFGHGKARVEVSSRPATPAGRGEAQDHDVPPFLDERVVATDIATLSGLFAGSLKASAAKWMGRLTGDEASVALLDAAFATPPLIITRTDWF